MRARTPLLVLALSACTIHHVTPYVPDAANAPQTADAVEASTGCFEASTAADAAICASPSLEAGRRAMLRALQVRLRAASIFGRDALLASQRAWLLALSAQCLLPDLPASAAPEAATCLRSALASREMALGAWPAPAANSGGAIAQYVALRAPAGAAAQPDPSFCAGFARRADAALRRTGTLAPASMGFEEVAGTHGPHAAPPIAVGLYDANVFGLFQRRARSVTIGDAPPAITPITLTQFVEHQSTANQGGRFSSFASQTGDYGSIDVFRDGQRLLALAADAWGSTTPAAPGEAAHAGIWDITAGAPVPVCLFDIYTRPAEPGVFGTLPDFTAWRAVLARIRGSADPPLADAVRRDQVLLQADTDFILLHMPLLAVEQAGAPGRTRWLRRRHDEVLDTLFAWSARNAANKALFDRAFQQLRPAAASLVRAYQTAQGLDAAEATQAGGTAIMELLYEATTTIVPALGASPDVPPDYRPRYPIVAAPQ